MPHSDTHMTIVELAIMASGPLGGVGEVRKRMAKLFLRMNIDAFYHSLATLVSRGCNGRNVWYFSFT